MEIKFYSRSVKYNLSFPHQFSSFNFLTYSSGICTSNTLKSQINCNLKTYINLVTDSLKGFLRVFLRKWHNYNAVSTKSVCPNKSLINRTFCPSYKKLQKLSYIFSSDLSKMSHNKCLLVLLLKVYTDDIENIIIIMWALFSQW